MIPPMYRKCNTHCLLSCKDIKKQFRCHRRLPNFDLPNWILHVSILFYTLYMVLVEFGRTILVLQMKYL